MANASLRTRSGSLVDGVTTAMHRHGFVALAVDRCPAQRFDDRSVLFDNDKRLVRFDLRRVVDGLYVEREELSADGRRTVQSMCFGHAAAFVRWCNDDPVRFDDPLLHARLLRSAGELDEQRPARD